MAHYGKFTITKDIAKVQIKGQGLAQLIVIASYLSDFTHKITECSKQEVTSCVISLIPNFPAGSV